MNCSAIAIGFLAGGQARRMGGGDKALIKIGNQTILQRQMRQTDRFAVRLVNANGDASRFADAGLPVIQDISSGFLGPLVGLLSCLDYLARHHPEITMLQSMATDAPFVPHDLTDRLYQAGGKDGQLAQPASNGRRHPVFGLWPVSIRQDLHDAVINQGVRKIDDFTSGYQMAVVEFDHPDYDMFMNLNRLEDVVLAEQIDARLCPA